MALKSPPVLLHISAAAYPSATGSNQTYSEEQLTLLAADIDEHVQKLENKRSELEEVQKSTNLFLNESHDTEVVRLQQEKRDLVKKVMEGVDEMVKLSFVEDSFKKMIDARTVVGETLSNVNVGSSHGQGVC